MCARPFRQGVAEYGCGQCLPCRVNKRRVWATRLLLESLCSVSTFFITLTYRDDELPAGGSVSLRDAQLWLKRVRRGMEPEKLRYYLVGEYGDISFRPHYHAIVYGTFRGAHVPIVEQRKGRTCECLFCRSWGKGFVDVQEPGKEALAYVASYTVKKMTGKDDGRLGGREPEFGIMSLKPGIGSPAAEVISHALVSKGGSASVARVLDVPGSVRLGSSGKQPLGRYLLGKVREEVGMVRPKNLFGRRERLESELNRLKDLQAALSVPGARDLHEQKRVQAARIAFARHQVSRSKKGFGL